MSEDEIISNAVLLLNAGHEATVHAIGNAVAAILASGLDPAALFATPDRTAATVEETLRFDPPLHLFTRYALEPVAFARRRAGRRRPHRPPHRRRQSRSAAFPDADRFDPLRSPAPQVAFGAGIHFCLGAPLARLELQVALPILFDRRPGLRLAEPPRFADRYHFRGLQALRVAG